MNAMVIIFGGLTVMNLCFLIQPTPNIFNAMGFVSCLIVTAMNYVPDWWK